MDTTYPENIPDKLKKTIDNYFFIKNGYSIVKHFVTFAIAALLLILLLSFQRDSDILFQLVDLSKTPSIPLVPALLLAFVTTIIYYYTIRSQVLQAYLWPEGDKRRTIVTVIIYISFCTILAMSVLYAANDVPDSYSKIMSYLFVSYLVATLSLTGVGWQGPSSWVEATGIKSPDYTEGRQAVEQITDILTCIRNKDDAVLKNPEKNLSDFKEAVEKLELSIHDNIDLEPKWARFELNRISDLIFGLKKVINDEFVGDNFASAGVKFQAACLGGAHKDFCRLLGNMSIYWPKWKCKEK
jgi:hypothetical protein